MSLFETIIALVAIIFAWWSPGLPTSDTTATTTASVVSVIDGDTIIVSLAGAEETVRYIGIDTPEPRREGEPECGSTEASAYNRDLVDGQTVRLVADREDRDRYGRLLRYVYVGEGEEEIFVNQAIVRAGFAQPLTIAPNNTFARELSRSAAAARSERVGNWTLCPGLSGYTIY